MLSALAGDGTMQAATWRVAAVVGAGNSRRLATDPLHGSGLAPMVAVAIACDKDFQAESGQPPFLPGAAALAAVTCLLVWGSIAGRRSHCGYLQHPSCEIFTALTLDGAVQECLRPSLCRELAAGRSCPTRCTWYLAWCMAALLWTAQAAGPFLCPGSPRMARMNLSRWGLLSCPKSAASACKLPARNEVIKWACCNTPRLQPCRFGQIMQCAVTATEDLCCAGVRAPAASGAVQFGAAAGRLPAQQVHLLALSTNACSHDSDIETPGSTAAAAARCTQRARVRLAN